MAVVQGDDFLASFLPYIPLILTVVGWYVANSASAKREIRKERRAEVDACCKMLAEILAKTRSYYTKGAEHEDSVKLGREVVFELHRVLQRIERLEDSCPKFEVSGTCAQLHEAATGGEFESKERKALPHDASEIMQIEYWTHMTMDRLEDGFVATFR